MASVTWMNLTEMEGNAYGPVPWHVAVDSVADFVALTGDDSSRWSEHAPPGFAASALFSVAPDLLAELYDHSVIHGEQTFHWMTPIPVGALLDVSGEVTRVRDRGGVYFLTFEMEANDGDVPVLAGKSLFLASGDSLAAGEAEFERTEPPHSYRGEPNHSQISASRADLVRYASATRDWNPVHWDHEAGVAAGFPGVVVHGLLQAGWALRVASANQVGQRPFDSARLRFRNPLLPARVVDHAVEQGDGTLDITLLDEEREYLTASIQTANE